MYDGNVVVLEWSFKCFFNFIIWIYYNIQVYMMLKVNDVYIILIFYLLFLNILRFDERVKKIDVVENVKIINVQLKFYSILVNKW